ncbi:MAG: sulfate adenylyltransferase subunit CysN [Arenicellales bacterium]|nr:sulfate adenylyltransferase subunit CysN [Arenicellales bacterium]
MSHQSELIATDIDAYLAQHERKELLRFLTCGSVDDGKSTLIGRMLIESKMVYEDQLAALEQDSQSHGTIGDRLDPALLTDGLDDERQQGITIDVAYRYFSTAKRKFIIADTPGHEQYTRNMATGASTCDLAIILIDARKGVLTQTKRHSFITSLLGVKHIVVAINKMDLVDYSQEVYERIRDEYIQFAARMSSDDVHFIPISALDGDNVVSRSEKMPWYDGNTLMHMLENVYIASDSNLQDFRFPVQYVNRPHLDFRGFCGTVASGTIKKGDEIMVLPARTTSRVASIETFDGEIEEAFTPLSVTLTLEDEIDASRGDMIVRVGNQPRVAQRMDAMVVWMGEDPMVPGTRYLFKQTTKVVPGALQSLRYQVDVNTLHREPAPSLQLNQIGRCEIQLDDNIMFDAYKRNRSTGSMVIIDRITNVTVGAVMILDEMQAGDTRDHWDDEPASAGMHQEPSQVTDEEREARFGQRGATVLITGLTGSGKRLVAHALERRLFDSGRACTLLDGPKMRLGVSKDLGFTPEGRSENMRRAAECARLLNDAGLITIASFLAPHKEVRDKARDVVGSDRFIEVFLDVPLEVCRERDTNGMYDLADSGEIQDFPGVTSPYEEPVAADLMLSPHAEALDECVEKILELLRQRGFIS